MVRMCLMKIQKCSIFFFSYMQDSKSCTSHINTPMSLTELFKNKKLEKNKRKKLGRNRYIYIYIYVVACFSHMPISYLYPVVEPGFSFRRASNDRLIMLIAALSHFFSSYVQ